MRIGIDLDGCANGHGFVDGCRKAANELYGIELDTMPPAEIWDFPVHQWGWTWDFFKQICNEGVDAGIIFVHGDPDDGFLEVCEKLKADGHTLHICTDRSFGTRSIHNTIDWLQKYSVPYDSLAFSADKTLLEVDVFVEDRDKNFEALWTAGTPCFLFDRPWNQHVETNNYGYPSFPDQIGDYRIKSWNEFYQGVCKLA